MMLEVRMLPMAFSARLLAGSDASRLAEGMTTGAVETTCEGALVLVSISSVADC